MSEPPKVVYGSDAMVTQLARLNLDYVALVPGSSFRGLHDSIVNFNGNRNPQILTCLHEEHSVAIAHGFAKVTEHPMAAVVHDAVGLMHATMAVYNAHCDRTPVLLLGGNGPLDAVRRRPWTDWVHTTGDEAALIRPYVKFDDQPASVQAAVQSILTATAAAAQIPRGPAYVCLDVALQEDRLPDPDAVHFPSTDRYLQAARNPPGPSAEDVSKVQRVLLAAKKQPLFLFGRVNRSQKSWDERVELAERYNARVLTDLKLAAAFPTKHPLHAAPPALFLNEQEIDVIRSADVIISFDWVDLAGTLKTAFPENNGLGEAPGNIRVVHITLDYPAIHDGWTKDHFAQPTVDIAVSADVDKTVSSLLAVAPPRPSPSSAPASEQTTILSASSPQDTSPKDQRLHFGDDGFTISPNEPIDLSFLARTLYATVPPDSLSLLRLPLSFPGADLIATHPLSHLGQDGGAGTGSGPGNSVGAALALRNLFHQDTQLAERILVPVAILGDGDFLMGCAALWTAVHHDRRVPMLVVVADNEAFGNDVMHQREVARQRGRDEGNAGVGTRIDEPRVDLLRVAAGFGAEIVGVGNGSGRVERRAQLRGVLERAVRRVREDGAVVVVSVYVPLEMEEDREGGAE
ncbi:thiamine pyrophosphate enzyme, N-terminal TPP binding domain-containing protein [Corynascus similis CBS 632.67]